MSQDFADAMGFDDGGTSSSRASTTVSAWDDGGKEATTQFYSTPVDERRYLQGRRMASAQVPSVVCAGISNALVNAAVSTISMHQSLLTENLTRLPVRSQERVPSHTVQSAPESFDLHGLF